MQKYKATSLRFCLVASVALSLSLGSCSFNGEPDPQDNPDGLRVTVTEPVERDYAEIKGDGVLRMITRYSSNTYFLHQGVEWGFEYELVHRFADNHDLALEVIIIGPDENPYDMLNSGKGDIIAANYTRTPERKQYVEFTRPYNLVNQQMVFSGEIANPPQTIEEVAERKIPITVRRNSSYYHRLKELRSQGHSIPIHLVSNKKDTESLLYEVSDNKYPATVADNNIFQASDKYMKGLVRGPVIAENDTIAWAVRKNASDLKTELNKYLYDHFRFGNTGEDPKRSTFLNVLRKRYFESGPQIAQYYNPESKISTAGVISPYDQLIKRVADSAGIDWLLVASVAAQETKFNPNSKSWAGAVGLMQVLPRYSKVSDEEMLYDVETNIREGVRIIKEHLAHYSYMDSTDQWSFALAAYNAGQGHLADARRLAIDQNKDPNDWKNASDALLKLMQRKYYKDARYGFCRGIETVRYVKEIKNRYKTYETILAMNEQSEGDTGLGVMGLFNVP
ncbi:membrane-bound lytic murein transglycosylase F [Fodinibius salinus]|uniref:Membrane-bound lytic murein transglycosylase F n=1 Tax=Fodinibius salinus TaxID=860790 RepID=A0A5D3YIS2_9BACT|nr:transporter substrate-binding domain-containing protein [Fodinibius salinus]TYP93398.1 membrane-bound lytic murein transglycosylase F [Fodinibius salinus]